MAFLTKVIADSVSPDGARLTTLEVTLPRIVLAEFNTHRMLSRNSASSRAIPVEKRIAMIEADPFVPEAFGKNQRGMQAGDALEGEAELRARLAWYNAMNAAVVQAGELAKLEVHKQLANRLLEPFAWHTIVCTATEWENFFALRCHPNAQPEIRTAAEMMREAMRSSYPHPVDYNDWHLPYLQTGEAFDFDVQDGRPPFPAIPTKVKVSVARCARVSYLTHDGKRDPSADLALYDRLASAGHMSPLEHVARPAQRADFTNGVGSVDIEDLRVAVGPDGIGPLLNVPSPTGPLECTVDVPLEHFWFGNFRGWVQHRKLIRGEYVFTGGAA